MSKAKYTRQYLGVTITSENYRDILSKEGRYGINFHSKHLKAYLRGDSYFTYDFERDEEGNVRRNAFGQRIPKEHKVLQQLIVIEK